MIISKVRVGVIGCGAVAQIMHLRYLRELESRFVITAICDLSTQLLDYIGELYNVQSRYLDYRSLLQDEQVDAVLVLSGGDHTEVVVDCLEAALWCFHKTTTFKESILAATNLGDDADTTAAVCGQIVGAFYGESAIPKRWIERLYDYSKVSELADALISN